MTTEERFDRLEGIVNTLAGAATAHDAVLEAHDRQIGALITIADKNQTAIDKLRASTENLERQWQAYLNTLRPQ